MKEINDLTEWSHPGKYICYHRHSFTFFIMPKLQSQSQQENSFLKACFRFKSITQIKVKQLNLIHTLLWFRYNWHDRGTCTLTPFSPAPPVGWEGKFGTKCKKLKVELSSLIEQYNEWRNYRNNINSNAIIYTVSDMRPAHLMPPLTKHLRDFTRACSNRKSDNGLNLRYI